MQGRAARLLPDHQQPLPGPERHDPLRLSVVHLRILGAGEALVPGTDIDARRQRLARVDDRDAVRIAPQPDAVLRRGRRRCVHRAADRGSELVGLVGLDDGLGAIRDGADRAEPIDMDRIMFPLERLNPKGRGPLTLALREAAGMLSGISPTARPASNFRKPRSNLSSPATS